MFDKWADIEKKLQEWPVTCHKGIMWVEDCKTNPAYYKGECEVWLKIAPNTWWSSYTLGEYGTKELIEYAQDQDYSGFVTFLMSHFNNVFGMSERLGIEEQEEY